MIRLSLHPSMHRMYHLSMHCTYDLSVHCASRLTFHQSVHCLFRLSIPTTTNVRNSPDGFPGTNYGEKNPSEIMAKIPHDVTLTLQQAKFLEESPDNTMRVKYLGNFMLTRIWVKLTVITLRNYVLGGFHVASHTMRGAHGSINKIVMESDPGPTYDVQRLWVPGGSSYSSRSSVPTNLDKLGKPKSYLD